jgi:hypothetical protein
VPGASTLLDSADRWGKGDENHTYHPQQAGGRAGMGIAAGRRAVACFGVLLLVGAPVTAQSPSPPAGDASAGTVCVLGLDELNGLTGLRFASMHAGPTNCTYDSDPADDLYTLDLRVVGPDPTVTEPIEDGLWLVRIDEDDGHETTVGGFPAWESPEGVWVDIGEDVFVVQPILFFMTDPPDPGTFLAAVAELALSRLPVGAAASETPQ